MKNKFYFVFLLKIRKMRSKILQEILDEIDRLPIHKRIWIKLKVNIYSFIIRYL